MPYLLLLGFGGLDAAGYSIIAPTAPEIAERTGAGPALVGALVASFPAGMIVGFALAGLVVARRGPRLLLLASLVVLALGSVAFALANGLIAYFPARALMGLGSGGLWVGITFDTLARWPGQEYVCMSRIFAAYSIGGLVGPALGGMGGVRGPFLTYAALVVAALPLALVAPPPAERRTFVADARALRARGFWLASAGILFAVVALGVVEGVLPIHLAERLGQAEIGALYVGASLIVAATSAAAASLAPRPILLAACFLVVVGISLAGAATGIPLWALSLLLAAVGIGLANTGSLGVLVQSVRVERIVTAMVVWSQLGILGYLVGPLAAGGIAETLGFAMIGVVPLAGALVVLAAFRLPTAPSRL